MISGSKLRDYHFAQGLAEGTDLTYVFFGNPGTAAELSRNLSPTKAVTPVPAPQKYTPSKVVRGLFGRLPLPVVNYTSSPMETTLRNLLRSEQFNVVHLDSIHFAAYLPLIKRLAPAARVMLNWHNIESELMERYAGGTSSALRNFYAGQTFHKMHALEADVLSSCFGHVVCSDREQSVLSKRNPHARIEVVENGVDTQYFKPSAIENTPKRLVFVGQMSYYANSEAIIWFVQNVWPSLRALKADLQLTIVGSSPGPQVWELAKEPGVQVTGTVPDVRPYYEDAFAAIVPLRTGGGTRLKILEAMAAGVPVISTAIGAEGLPVTNQSDILLVAESESWASAVAYLADDGRRSALVRRARDLVCARYDWAAIGHKLLATYSRWSEE